MRFDEYWGDETEYQVEMLIQNSCEDDETNKLETILNDKEKMEKLKKYVTERINDDSNLWERINYSVDYYIGEYLNWENQ